MPITRLDSSSVSDGRSKGSNGLSNSHHRPVRWWRNDSILVGAFVLVLLAVTARDYGLTLDEPVYIKNSIRLIDWFKGLGTDGLANSFSSERLAEGFYFARPDSKNLPLVSYVSTLGYLAVGQFDAPLVSWRWGNLIVFAITAGIVFQWIKAEVSRPAAFVAIAGLLGTPRLYAHANLLAMDTLVGCLWVLASWALWHSERSWPRIIVFAVLCGIGAMAKPTFWFAIPGWIVWCAAFRRHDLKRILVSLATITPLVAIALAPMWWTNPVAGFLGYIDMLRHDPIGWKIDVFYFGNVYQTELSSPVPWHSVFVLPLITTPVWLLLFLAAGLFRGVGNCTHRKAACLWLLGLMTLPLVCLLPSTPAHDGLRLYRAAFFFVPLIAAVGFEAVRQIILKNNPRKSYVAVFAVFILAIWPNWRAHPAELSYYNALIGGLPGTSDSFEISYWWDLASPEVLANMQEKLPQNAKFFTYPHYSSHDLVKQWGYLRPDLQHVVPEHAQYVLIYARLGQIYNPTGSRSMSQLFLTGQPIWEHKVDGVRVMALFPLGQR